ncbi:MAG: IS630 family transposase [Crocinitomicaceae bacterium]|nr:IS630 family transposase [Crocinitomicaceae bacterium]
MSKKAHLEPYLNRDELKTRYLSAKDLVESRRWHLLWLVSLDWSIKKAAEIIGYNYDYAKKIVKNYNSLGELGVVNRQKKGKRRAYNALLTDNQLLELIEALKSPPEDQGLWTGPKVARWIEKKTGIEKVWNQRGWDYLKKCRYSMQLPRKKHRKGDKDEQAEFKANLPLKVQELQRENPNATIEVWSFDEHRLGLKPIIRRIWAPIGQKPIAVIEHRYEWLYLYGFVHPKTGQTEWFIIPRVNTQWFNQVLAAIAEATGAGKDKIILIVLDQARWHTSKNLEIPEGIVLETLPPYSPELQPAERLWCLADEPLVNRTFDSLDELEETLAQRCCRERRKNVASTGIR